MNEEGRPPCGLKIKQASEQGVQQFKSERWIRTSIPWMYYFGRKVNESMTYYLNFEWVLLPWFVANSSTLA
jgi:hypothetical protein